MSKAPKSVSHTAPAGKLDPDTVEDAFARVRAVLLLASAAVTSETVDRDGMKDAVWLSLSNAADDLEVLESQVLGALRDGGAR